MICTDAEHLNLAHRRETLHGLITLEIEDFQATIPPDALCYVAVSNRGGDATYCLCRFIECTTLYVKVHSIITGQLCRVDPRAVRIVLGERSEPA